MPELKYTFSYPLALAFMVLIAVGMYLFFRKGGWFE
jgi:magnesium transporter